MKAGLLTYHYVCNEGALWQAYSSLVAFNRVAPELGLKIANFEDTAKSSWNRATFGAEKCASFQAFRRSFVEENSLEEPSLQEFDCLVVGSDIVWQFGNNLSLLKKFHKSYRLHPVNQRPTSFPNQLRRIKQKCIKTKNIICEVPPPWARIPNVYWLPWKTEKKKVSFAASIGYSNPDGLKRHELKLAKELLGDFDLISVRDSHTKNFVEKLIDREVDKIADPAWHYSDPLVEVFSKLEEHGWDGKKPLAGILYPRGSRYGADLDEWVLDEFRRQGFSVVSIIDQNPNVDIDMARADLQPFDWWSVIKELDFLLTVRTHPNIAALKYHTPFLNLDITSALNVADVSKSHDMLAEFGLEDLCVFRHEELNRSNIRAKLRKALSMSWDWGAVDSKILQHQKKANHFISRVASLIGHT